MKINNVVLYKFYCEYLALKKNSVVFTIVSQDTSTYMSHLRNIGNSNVFFAASLGLYLDI